MSAEGNDPDQSQASSSGAAAVAATDDGGWRPGEFGLTFLYMGQGDCTLIKCPDGRNIMIDCGSSRHDGDLEEIKDLLRQKDAIEAGQDLDALIITHPDKDHVNQLGLLNPFKRPGDGGRSEEIHGIHVKNIFISSAKALEGNWLPGEYSKYCKRFANRAEEEEARVFRVVLTEDECLLQECAPDTVSDDDDDVNDAVPRLVDRRCIIMHKNDGDSDSDDWCVSIIAGSHAPVGVDNNPLSLVALLEIGDEKIMIMGDATVEVGNYIMSHFGEGSKTDLRKLSLLQAPHHGSEASASTEEFVKWLQPQRVAISAARYEYTYHLPRWTVLNRYIQYVGDRDDGPWPLAAWQDSNQATLETWQSWIKNDLRFEKILNTQRQVKGVLFNPTKSPFEFEGERIQHQGQIATYALSQIQSGKDIKITGLAGTGFPDSEGNTSYRGGNLHYYFNGISTRLTRSLSNLPENPTLDDTTDGGGAASSSSSGDGAASSSSSSSSSTTPVSDDDDDGPDSSSSSGMPDDGDD